MRLHDLKPRPGANHRRKRLGRGESSGKGKTSGKGHKGQKARAGGSIRPGFEGGQMPLYRRLPRRGFNNKRFATTYAVVNVGLLEERFEAGATVDEQALRDARLVKGSYDGIKILGSGELKKSLNVKANKISTSAREKIEKAGGSVEEIVPPPNPAEKPAKEKKPAGAKPAPKKEAPKEEAPAAEPPVEEAPAPSADASEEE